VDAYEIQNVHQVKLVLKDSAQIHARFCNVDQMPCVKRLGTEQYAYVQKDSKEMLELEVVGKLSVKEM
jgi:hypothetical protein